MTPASKGAVGQSLPAADSVDRVTGRVGYTLGLEVPGMAVGKILRSEVPHARIVRIDTAAAEALRGVYAVITGADIEGRLGMSNSYGRVLRDQKILADGIVRFVGEPVAAVAAVDRDTAEEALRLITVEYDELPAVFTPQDALAEDAPVLHDPRPELQPDFVYSVAQQPEPTNIANHFKLRHGDVERGFAEADLVFEDTFTSPAVQHVALEPHVTLARFERCAVTIWSSTQMPNSVRMQMAEILSMPQSRVRVVAPILGGGFGSKGSLRLEPVTVALAKAAGRPVKVTLERDEEFVTVTKHAAQITMRSGVTRDGRLVARKITTYMNTGAYADVGPIVVRNAGSGGIGPYSIPHVQVDSYAVYTNIVPAGAFRGFGVSQYAWAYESHTDMIARRMGLDPLEFRRRNVVREGDEYATGETLVDIHYDELFDRTIEAMGSRPEDAPDDRFAHGRSVVAVIKATVTPSTSTASVRMNDDGSLDVLTSSVEMGQGARTVLAQIAADALGVSYDKVTVSEPDTALTPYDQQTSSSRTTYSMGNAVSRAAADLAQKLLGVAADQLGRDRDTLDIGEGAVVVAATGEVLAPYRAVLGRGRLGNLIGTGSFITDGGLDLETGQGIGSVHWHTGVSGVDVEVDRDTGRVVVTKVVSSLFAGRVINPRMSELQIEGSTCFGLGQALFEEIHFDSGQVMNANLSDYMIPSFLDVPSDIKAVFLEHDEPGTEVHGLAETSLPPIMPAVANAVYDAVGVRITDLPITAEKVLSAQRDRAESTAPGEPTEDLFHTLQLEETGR
jgi:CO/xanthine dehydrogenase Mo-binding subunit